MCRLLHLKIISLKKPLQIGLCNKAIGNYETDKDSFENDINANKKISLEAVDGLCIMNKFLQKYSTLIDLKKAPPSIQESTRRALSYQPLYLKRLSSDKDYLGQLQCINLK